MLHMLSVTFISPQSRNKRVSLLVGGLSRFIMFTGGEVKTWLATWGKLKNLILTAGMIYQQRGGGLQLFFFYSFWFCLIHTFTFEFFCIILLFTALLFPPLTLFIETPSLCC